MKARAVTATQARTHFGELLEQVVQNDEAIVVERSGRPVAVILPFARYDQMLQRTVAPDWRPLLDDMYAYLRVTVGTRELMAPAEVVRMSREERDAQQAGLS